LILNLFKAGFCRQPIEQFPNFIYGFIHAQLMLPCSRLGCSLNGFNPAPHHHPRCLLRFTIDIVKLKSTEDRLDCR
jgi:hypothetical protein